MDESFSAEAIISSLDKADKEGFGDPAMQHAFLLNMASMCDTEEARKKFMDAAKFLGF